MRFSAHVWKYACLQHIKFWIFHVCSISALRTDGNGSKHSLMTRENLDPWEELVFSKHAACLKHWNKAEELILSRLVPRDGRAYLASYYYVCACSCKQIWLWVLTGADITQLLAGGYRRCSENTSSSPAEVFHLAGCFIYKMREPLTVGRQFSASYMPRANSKKGIFIRTSMNHLRLISVMLSLPHQQIWNRKVN